MPRLRRSDGDGDADVADAHGADAAAARRPVKRVKRVERRMESRWSEGERRGWRVRWVLAKCFGFLSSKESPNPEFAPGKAPGLCVCYRLDVFGWRFQAQSFLPQAASHLQVVYRHFATSESRSGLHTPTSLQSFRPPRAPSCAGSIWTRPVPKCRPRSRLGGSKRPGDRQWVTC